MDKIVSLPYPDFKLLEYIDPDKFDANNEALRAKIDEIVQYVNDLSSIVAGSSGAEKIGSAPITGVTGTNVHAQINGVCSLIDQLVLGQIADGSITDAKLNKDVKIGSLTTLGTTDKTSVVSAINEIISAVNDIAEDSIGILESLTTTDKTNIVNALNEINGSVGTLANLLTTNKTSAVAAINEVKQNLDTHKAEYMQHLKDNTAHGEIANMYRSGKDANGIFVTLEYKRTDGTLFKKSVLSGGTSPKYTTRTVTYYAANGTTVLLTKVYTLTYTGDDLTSEVTN